MVFDLEFQPRDWMIFGAQENWVYITEKSVPNIDYNRYIISDFGRVFDLQRNLRCKEYDFGGYKTVALHRSIGGYQTYLIHRIMMIEFNGFDPDPEKKVVNHKDGTKYCCLLDNLEWTTNSGNAIHAMDTGLFNDYGENARLAKATNEDVLKIMYMLQDGVPLDEVVKYVPDYIDSKLSWIHSILNGRWNKLARDNNITFAEYKDRSDRFSVEEKEKIGAMLKNGESLEGVVRGLGYDYDNMSNAERRAFKSSVSAIKCGRASSYIAEKYGLIKTPRQNPNSIFSLDELHMACKIFQDGFTSYDDTLIQIGYDPSSMTKDERFRYVNALSALKRKKNYSEITSQYNF